MSKEGHRVSRWRAVAVLLPLIAILVVPAETRAAGTPSPNAELTKVTGSDTAKYDQFGKSVAISGTTAIVGSFRDDDHGRRSGSAYVFARDSATGSWNEVQKLTAGDASAYNRFGQSVAISGDTVVIGAPGRRDDGFRSGAAYVFRFDAATGTWAETAKLTASDAAERDFFGTSVAVSGTTAIVGAPGNDHAGRNSGSAYVFSLDTATDDWVEEAHLTGSDAPVKAHFGQSVAISGATLVVGAWTDSSKGTNSGSAYVFSFDRRTHTWAEVAKLTGSDVSPWEFFGSAVAASEAYIVVGVWYHDHDACWDCGSAYVFALDAQTGEWHQTAELVASDAALNDSFGRSVTISGSTAVIGAPNDRFGGIRSGSAYVFQLDAETGDWVETSKLASMDRAKRDTFGGSVSVSGTTAIVGALRDDDAGPGSGSASVFEIATTPPDRSSDG